jgi:hypothetical protein
MQIRITILVGILFTLAFLTRGYASAPTMPQYDSGVPDAQATYDRQLADYNAAVEQQKKWTLEQEAKERQFRITTLVTLIAVFAFLMMWFVRRNSRVTASALAKADESLQHSRQLIQQSERAIELLKSINDRLDKKPQ